MATPGPDPRELRARVDEQLAGFLTAQEARLPAGPHRVVLDRLRRFVLAGGKRLRPTFCYWGWRGAGGADGTAIVVAAAALELFHAFALIHDDIMDGSDRRRGEPSLHRWFADLHARSTWRGDPERYGRDVALLCGALCAAWSDELLHRCGLPADRVARGHRVYATMRTEAIAGQFLDLSAGTGQGSVADALRVVRLKAARYTVTRPMQMGAALAGAADETQTAYAAFGDPLGDAFQLRDDVLGVFGDPAVTGKPVLDDLREGKSTVLIALARAAADRDQSVKLAALFGRPDLDAEGAATLRAVIVGTGALDRVEQMIKVRAEEALAALARAPLTGSARSALAALAARAVDRRV
nr:polyprenyl synthetase family protein [Micromonospora sp. DSM 115978]